MEIQQKEHITILQRLISPDVCAALLTSTDEEIAATFVTVSERYGLSAAYMRANWRMVRHRISVATSPRNSEVEM